ncbi:Angelicin synthase [Handroanthus impetiginosus]|uniref:Angelicin synthase n=1 Tax=Handroanthus impetiginosus TaxID=429701 RepID=A0A2G9GHN6_9LAMI|nr:Angelicin synthase [Handroanthus impetiginosus]
MATNELVLANIVHKFDCKLPDEDKDLDMSERPGVIENFLCLQLPPSIIVSGFYVEINSSL